jgi:hypothetical protein
MNKKLAPLREAVESNTNGTGYKKKIKDMLEEKREGNMDLKHNVKTVLMRIIEQLDDNDCYVDFYAEDLESMLNTNLGDDMYGTEGQCDPRGDFRNGKWSMWNIEEK